MAKTSARAPLHVIAFYVAFFGLLITAAVNGLPTSSATPQQDAPAASK